MTILEKRKRLKIIENLNNEYHKNGSSQLYENKLNELIENLAGDGQTLIMLLNEIQCEDKDRLGLVEKIQAKIIALGQAKFITRFAVLEPNADMAALTRAICNENIEDGEIITFARVVNNAKIGIIARELADRKSVQGLQNLKKVLGLKRRKFKQAIDMYINYINEEYGNHLKP